MNKMKYAVYCLFFAMLLILPFQETTGQSHEIPNPTDIYSSHPEIDEYYFLSSGDLKYVAYKPGEDSLEPGLLYPLVLYMHGSCSECITHERITLESNVQIWHHFGENRQTEPTYVIAPVGGRGGWTQSEKRETILGIVDHFIDTYPVDPKRIYITGFSAGAGGVWNYIQYRPNFFAAANPQAFFPASLDPELIRNTPIWATAGELEVPARLENLINAVKKMRAANGDPRGALTWETGVNPRLTIFPEVGHGGAQVATQQMPGYMEWIYSQRIDSNHAPNIYFMSPAHEDTYKGVPAEIPCTIVSNDPDGDELKIEIKLNGLPLKNSRTNSCEEGIIHIDSAGEYILEAVATDSGGKWASTVLTVYVVENEE